jgi:outer membrane protein assembly factor BamB
MSQLLLRRTLLSTASTLAACAALLTTDVGEARAQLRGGLLGRAETAPLGLEPVWSTYVRVDAARGRLTSLQLTSGLLLAQTDQGVVQAIDPETGRTLWVREFGRSDYETMPPSANAKFVAVTNGPMLYLFDRASGAEMWTQRLSSSPSAGTGMNDERVFVPLDTGIIEGYLLERGGLNDSVPKRYSGQGGAEYAPVVAGKRFNWIVAQGYVYSREDTFKDIKQFRYRLDDKISAQLTLMPPNLYAASRHGSVYCLSGENGNQTWRFSLGNSVSHPLLAIDGALYVISELGDMVRLDPATGKQIWYARGVQRFVSAGANRLYLTDVYGRLTARDANGGTLVAAGVLNNFDVPCYNTETDRLYFATSTGVVQCVREIQQREPLKHSPGAPTAAAPMPGEPAPAADPNAAPPAAPAAGANPFGM